MVTRPSGPLFLTFVLSLFGYYKKYIDLYKRSYCMAGKIILFYPSPTLLISSYLNTTLLSYILYQGNTYHIISNPLC